jgi:hypothetical protein
MSSLESSKLDERRKGREPRTEFRRSEWLDERLEEYRELLTYLHDH